VDDDCQQRVCLAGLCTTAFAAANTALAVQTPGDCKRAVCDGLGGVLPQILDSDTPADDTNVCTGEICTNGIPSHPALQAGTVCTQSGGRLCNGSSAAPACVGCLAVTNCPGTDTLCQQRACQDNACVTVNAPAGTAAEADAAGNCHKNVCGSTGNVVSQIDNTDTPAEDGNSCTLGTCNAGTPAQVPVATGTMCAQNNGHVCNGTAACVECITAADCPGTDTICRQRTCGANNTCGTVNAAAGIDAEADATGNCHKAVCNGNGGVDSQIDDNDKPAADTNQCTTATCTAGVASQAPVTPGTTCSQGGGKVCSGTACVECIVATDCAGTDSACQHRTCTANTCGTAFANAGDPAEADAAGNCHKAVCNGSGGVDSLVDDTDKPVDGNVCTNDVCTAGVATNPTLPAGTICNADNVHVCSGSSATCNPLTFRVVRVGDGSAALTNASTATFIEERQLDGTQVGSPLALPTAASGGNMPLTLSGSASSDGALALSGDGRFLTLAGYGEPPGTAGVVGIAATTINRVVARVDVAGTINTTTRFNFAFSANNVRSAASADGSGFWIGGNGNSTTQGVWYNPLGNNGGEVQIISTPGNTRWVQVIGGQLYVTGNGSNLVGVDTIGTGLPTTTGQTAALLPGLASGGSPFGYVLLDVNSTVVGLDTLYVADDGTTAGIKKYTFNGTIWSAAGTLNASPATGFRGLAGYAVSGTVTLIASTIASSQNQLVVFVDNGTSVTANSIRTADANTVLRGVALSPHFQP